MFSKSRALDSTQINKNTPQTQASNFNSTLIASTRAKTNITPVSSTIDRSLQLGNIQGHFTAYLEPQAKNGKNIAGYTWAFEGNVKGKPVSVSGWTPYNKTLDFKALTQDKSFVEVRKQIVSAQKSQAAVQATQAQIVPPQNSNPLNVIKSFFKGAYQTTIGIVPALAQEQWNKIEKLRAGHVTFEPWEKAKEQFAKMPEEWRITQDAYYKVKNSKDPLGTYIDLIRNKPENRAMKAQFDKFLSNPNAIAQVLGNLAGMVVTGVVTKKVVTKVVTGARLAPSVVKATGMPKTLGELKTIVQNLKTAVNVAHLPREQFPAFVASAQRCTFEQFASFPKAMRLAIVESLKRFQDHNSGVKSLIDRFKVFESNIAKQTKPTQKPALPAKQNKVEAIVLATKPGALAAQDKFKMPTAVKLIPMAGESSIVPAPQRKASSVKNEDQNQEPVDGKSNGNTAVATKPIKTSAPTTTGIITRERLKASITKVRDQLDLAVKNKDLHGLARGLKALDKMKYLAFKSGHTDLASTIDILHTDYTKQRKAIAHVENYPRNAVGRPPIDIELATPAPPPIAVPDKIKKVYYIPRDNSIVSTKKPIIKSKTIVFIQYWNDRPLNIVGSPTYIKSNVKNPSVYENSVISRLVHKHSFWPGRAQEAVSGHDLSHLLFGLGLDQISAESVKVAYPKTGIDLFVKQANEPYTRPETRSLNGILVEAINSSVFRSAVKNGLFNQIEAELPQYLRDICKVNVQNIILRNRPELAAVANPTTEFKRQVYDIVRGDLGILIEENPDTRQFGIEPKNKTWDSVIPANSFDKAFHKNPELIKELRHNCVEYLRLVCQAEYNFNNTLPPLKDGIEFGLSHKNTKVIIEYIIENLRKVQQRNPKSSSVPELINFYRNLLKNGRDGSPHLK